MPFKKLRIVIIDDEECIRDSLAMFLAELGHEVLTFDTPTMCPAFHEHDCSLPEACADIVIIDQNMPNMTGLEFLKTLTQKGCLIVPPNRIIMTGLVTAQLEAEILKMGCQIVQKPLRFDKLEEIVKKASAFISTDRKLSVLEGERY